MNERTYNNEEILWKIDIPDGWKVMSIDKLTSLRDKGNKMIEDLGGKISEQAQTTLINFQKNEANMFRSTAERYTAEEKMNWSEHIDFLIDVTSKTFAANEIRTENLPIELEIDGLTFRGFHSQLIAPNGDVFGVQEFYARIINGYYFSVNLTYTNLEDKSILHKAWQNSRFFKFPGVSSN